MDPDGRRQCVHIVFQGHGQRIGNGRQIGDPVPLAHFMGVPAHRPGLLDRNDHPETRGTVDHDLPPGGGIDRHPIGGSHE
ncbi:hypothetical protein [Desulfosarcina cetonica]|uniref:hypothetical protein n=1 Tax=Desulfosarcina cetonica TaxID=90730 RepID=UPI0006D21650|nr:hypothetical protein [Desulfosarcina cetonica]